MSNEASARRAPARRILSLALPYLPTDRLRRLSNGRSSHNSPTAPVAVVAKVKNALRLVALDEMAEALGLVRGQALADARAMIPHLVAADADEAADLALLESVADWAERYTPLVALDPPYGLFLDVTGCAHLFGGEAAMVADLARRIGRQGFAARAAVADTPGAASAAARFTDCDCVPAGEAAALLAPLPLAALRLDSGVVSAMDRVGLKKIGQIAGAPRAPLAARFGAGLIRQLDRALGVDEEAIGPRRPPPSYLCERRFAEPIAREEDIAATLTSLAATLAATLEKHGTGARMLELSLFRVDGAVRRIVVGAARPIRAPKLILDLFREKFAALGDEIDAGFGFDMARLAAVIVASADPTQIDLTGDAVAEADLAGLVDRIGVRLGPESVSSIVAHESHLPERAEILRLPQAHVASLPPPAGPLDRPVRLFSPPEPVEAIAEIPDGPPVNFRWRRARYEVARAEGPERIAAEWWREDALTRDYFRVEDSEGHRFWIFREGLYERETGAPRWFMHGVFA